MKHAKYHPPPLRPPPPEPADEPWPAWLPGRREWLDVIDGQGHIVAPCDGWTALVKLIRAGSIRAGKYRVDDVDGGRVAELVVDAAGQSRIYLAAPKRARG